MPFKVELPSLTFDWASQIEGSYDYWSYQLRGQQRPRARGIPHHLARHADQLGSWYGLEGTSWTNPPLFDNADTRYHGGRAYLEVGNGHHIQDIGWIDHGILYWINNTLFDDLSNAQMVALAESARPVG